MHVPLAAPTRIGETLRFRTKPREKRAFRTVLDAADLFADGGVATATWNQDLVLDVELSMSRGRATERVEHTRTGDNMTLTRLERKIYAEGDARSRDEIIEFASSTHRLPEATYVDTTAPFVLGSMPWDGKPRSIYLWICDRFVAKVYYESHGNHTVTVPAGRFETTEVLLYPDLNDWVKLPSIISKLSKPFLPKYHMWYERETKRLVRFEGPLGPPGAPEIVIELDK